MVSEETVEGSKRAVDGQWRAYYGGYWIKVYDAPADTLTAKKQLIEALTRRLFNHVEHGLNIPGLRLDEARRAFDAETDAGKKRVKGAMLAGALFNRATAVFTKAVELQGLGIEINVDNALMRQCGEYLQEALALGKMVLHCSGEEGIDELWGEPFKAFVFPIEEFYKSRYIKIGQTMRDIDRLTAEMSAAFETGKMFPGVRPLLSDLARVAKIKCETLHTDPEIFDVWAEFVTAGERVSAFEPQLPQRSSVEEREQAAHGLRLLAAGRELIFNITRARVPMPKSTALLIDRLRQFGAAQATPGAIVVQSAGMARLTPAAPAQSTDHPRL